MRKVGRLTEMTQHLVSKIRGWEVYFVIQKEVYFVIQKRGLFCHTKKEVYFVIQKGGLFCHTKKEVSNMTLQDITDRLAPCEYIKLIDKGINKATWCGLRCNIPSEYMNKSVTNIYSKMYYDDSGLIIIIE